MCISFSLNKGSGSLLETAEAVQVMGYAFFFLYMYIFCFKSYLLILDYVQGMGKYTGGTPNRNLITSG